MSVYLDNSATTPCSDTAILYMNQSLAAFGNPSSLHRLGIDAENFLTRARKKTAALIGAASDEIIFTSGGTESNNLALLGGVMGRRGGKIIAGATEHDSVLQPLKRLAALGYTVELAAPDKNGAVTASALESAVTPDTVMVSVMPVNNETGAAGQTAGLRRALDAAGAKALIHCDAVQAFGKLSFTADSLGADLISISAHKVHGPKGAGALYVRKGVRLAPQSFGGGQERGLRAGTEPVPAIAGFLGAMEDLSDDTAHIAALKERLTAGLRALDNTVINCHTDFPYIVNFSLPGYKSETVLHYLSNKGIYVSSGSACARGKSSHVLAAMGLPKTRADSALRVSFSRYNTPGDVDNLLTALDSAAKELVKSRVY